MKLPIRFALLLLLIVSVSTAQQLPQYTMFMNNRLLFNPAYAGTSGGFNATATGRWQWAGFKGAPNTQSIAMDANVPNSKIGLGLSLTRDEIAITSFTNITLSYAYHLPVGGGKLSMGLSGSVNRVKVAYDEIYVPDADINFTQQTSASRFNFGAGLYYDRSDFWIGFSMPEILQNNYDENGETFYNQSRHFFLAGGYRYEVNPQLRLEPNLSVKAVQGGSLSMDVNVMAWINDRVGGGIGYRAKESVDMIIQLKITNSLNVGYAYDYVINKIISNVANGSHEVMISLKVPLEKKLHPYNPEEEKHHF